MATRPELQSNGKWRWPLFTGLPAPRWRFSSWEGIDAADREAIRRTMWYLVSTLPFNVSDVELWGSRAFGMADEMSDFDFNLVVEPLVTDYEREEWWWDFTNSLNEASHALGVRIEAAPSAPSQKEANIVYSLRDRKFYGKEWGDVIPQRRRWDKKAGTWVTAPLRVLKHQRESDPWLNQS